MGDSQCLSVGNRDLAAGLHVDRIEADAQPEHIFGDSTRIAPHKRITRNRLPTDLPAVETGFRPMDCLQFMPPERRRDGLRIRVFPLRMPEIHAVAEYARHDAAAIVARLDR